MNAIEERFDVVIYDAKTREVVDVYAKNCRMDEGDGSYHYTAERHTETARKSGRILSGERVGIVPTGVDVGDILPDNLEE